MKAIGVDRTLPASTWRLPAIRWRYVPIAALVVWNVVGLAQLWPWVPAVGLSGISGDWDIFRSIDPHNLYGATAGGFRWSPPMGWLLAFVIVPAGPVLWSLLHIGAAMLMPRWWMSVAILISFPFWMDYANGNVLIFCMVAAWWALAGNRYGTWAFMALAVLVPRPLMLPVLAWLLWKRPESRVPFAVCAVAVLGVSTMSGDLLPWLHKLLLTPGGEMTSRWNIGPSRFIGYWWLAIGVPLAAWLTRRGYVGLASIAVTPYLLGYYLLFGLLEVGRRSTR